MHKLWLSKFGRVNLDGPDGSSNQKLVDNENGNLFTGEACIITKYNNVQTKEMIDDYTKAFMSTRVSPGLYSRSAGGPSDDNYHIVSHDEYNGLMFMWTMIPEYRYLANEVIDYGKKHHWQFIDGEPGADGIRFLKAHPIESLKIIFKLVKLWVQKRIPEFKDYRKESRPLSYIMKIMRPRDRAFFKLVSTEYSPNLIDVLDLSLSIVFASKTPKGDTSGKLIAWYRMICIDRLDYKLGFIKKLSLKIAHRFFVKGLKKQYGSFPLNEMMKIYYPSNHPLIELSKGM